MDTADRPYPLAITPDGLRSRAERVRALARAVAHDQVAPTLIAFAEELEAKAMALEVPGATSG